MTSSFKKIICPGGVAIKGMWPLRYICEQYLNPDNSIIFEARNLIFCMVVEEHFSFQENNLPLGCDTLGAWQSKGVAFEVHV